MPRIANQSSFKVQWKSRRNLLLDNGTSKSLNGDLPKQKGGDHAPTHREACRKALSMGRATSRAPCLSMDENNLSLRSKQTRSTSTRTVLIPTMRKTVSSYRVEDMISSDSFGVRSDHWWEENSMELTNAEPLKSPAKRQAVSEYRRHDAFRILPPKVVLPSSRIMAEDKPCHQTNDEGLDRTLHEQSTRTIVDPCSTSTVSQSNEAEEQSEMVTSGHETNVDIEGERGASERLEQDISTSPNKSNTPDKSSTADKSTTPGKSATPDKSTSSEKCATPDKSTSPDKSATQSKKDTSHTRRKRSPKRTRSLDCFLASHRKMMEESISSMRFFGTD